jgi:formylglycine-generating enzyme
MMWLACVTPPEGMLAIPGGRFEMGRDVSPVADQTPAHTVTLPPFYFDAHLVTVADFRRFVEGTGHRTSAERAGFGMTATEGMANWQWFEVDGATWRAPWGPGIAVHDDHPVTMVSWNDATAYCSWLGKRLPTEAEWEYAMRAGSENWRFPWGPRPERPDGSVGLNYWQGDGHEQNLGTDGHLYVSPVRAFPPNAWGVYDPSGNVWQFVADWYAPDTYGRDAAGVVDPTGPAEGTQKVTRGGSWWCSQTTCSGYGVWHRGKAHPGAAFSNNGFRCARDG